MLTPPASVTRITNIQTRTPFKLQSTSDITPNPPSAFTMTVGADLWLPNAALISITGVAGKYTGGMASSPPITLPANTGNARMITRFALNAGSLTALQALEMGCKFTNEAGNTFNGQIQFDYSQSATEMIPDVTNSAYLWSPAAPAMAKFAPYIEHEVAIDWQLSAGILFAGIMVDGAELALEPQQPIAPQSLGWALDEFLVGFQPDANLSGGSYQWFIHRCDVELW